MFLGSHSLNDGFSYGVMVPESLGVRFGELISQANYIGDQEIFIFILHKEEMQKKPSNFHLITNKSQNLCSFYCLFIVFILNPLFCLHINPTFNLLNLPFSSLRRQKFLDIYVFIYFFGAAQCCIAIH